MKIDRAQKRRRVGDPSSKYGYCPWKIDDDFRDKKAAAEALYQDFRGWMIEKNVTPDECRYLFIRLYDEFLQEEIST